MANRFPLIFNSGAGQIQELAASDNLDLTSSNLVNAGILFTSSGSQTAPSISIGNGTTYPPGLYSPGTDQLAVATNGTGRLFIDASGKIGINTTPPAGNQGLYVSVSSPTADTAGIQVKNASNAALEMLLTGATYSYVGVGANETWLRSSKAGAGANLNIGSDESIAIKFISNAAERLRITSAGLVGIGTSSPGSKFQIDDGDIRLQGSAPGKIIFVSTANGVSQNATLEVQNDGLTTNTGEFRFSTRNQGDTLAERMRISAAGKVGIGTTDPGSYSTYGNKLVVYGTGTNGPGMTIATGAADTGSIFFADGTTGNEAFRGAVSYSHGDDALLFQTSATEKARIRADGMFEVKGAGTAGSSPAFSVNGSAPANSAIIDTSGRLLVGTPTGKGKLSILQPNTSTIGDSANAGISIVSVDGNAAGRINSIDFMAGFNIDTATVSMGYICTDASAYGKGDIFFATRDTTTDVGATERMRIKANGDVSIATGNLIIGTAGKGIDFSADGNPAGMTSELLDDYEEGTWTPALKVGGSDTGITYTERAGQYIKIGKLVYIRVGIFLGTHAGLTGNLTITTLPFTPQNVDGAEPFFRGASATGFGEFAAVVTSSSTTILLRNPTTFADLTDAVLAVGTRIYFTGCYPAA